MSLDDDNARDGFPAPVAVAATLEFMREMQALDHDDNSTHAPVEVPDVGEVKAATHRPIVMDRFQPYEVTRTLNKFTEDEKAVLVQHRLDAYSALAAAIAACPHPDALIREIASIVYICVPNILGVAATLAREFSNKCPRELSATLNLELQQVIARIIGDATEVPVATIIVDSDFGLIATACMGHEWMTRAESCFNHSQFAATRIDDVATMAAMCKFPKRVVDNLRATGIRDATETMGLHMWPIASLRHHLDTVDFYPSDIGDVVTRVLEHMTSPSTIEAFVEVAKRKLPMLPTREGELVAYTDALQKFPIAHHAEFLPHAYAAQMRARMVFDLLFEDTPSQKMITSLVVGWYVPTFNWGLVSGNTRNHSTDILMLVGGCGSGKTYSQGTLFSDAVTSHVVNLCTQLISGNSIDAIPSLSLVVTTHNMNLTCDLQTRVHATVAKAHSAAFAQFIPSIHCQAEWVASRRRFPPDWSDEQVGAMRRTLCDLKFKTTPVSVHYSAITAANVAPTGVESNVRQNARKIVQRAYSTRGITLTASTYHSSAKIMGIMEAIAKTKDQLFDQLIFHDEFTAATSATLLSSQRYVNELFALLSHLGTLKNPNACFNNVLVVFADATYHYRDVGDTVPTLLHRLTNDTTGSIRMHLRVGTKTGPNRPAVATPDNPHGYPVLHYTSDNGTKHITTANIINATRRVDGEVDGVAVEETPPPESSVNIHFGQNRGDVMRSHAVHAMAVRILKYTGVAAEVSCRGKTAMSLPHTGSSSPDLTAAQALSALRTSQFIAKEFVSVANKTHAIAMYNTSINAVGTDYTMEHSMQMISTSFPAAWSSATQAQSISRLRSASETVVCMPVFEKIPSEPDAAFDKSVAGVAIPVGGISESAAEAFEKTVYTLATAKAAPQGGLGSHAAMQTILEMVEATATDRSATGFMRNIALTNRTIPRAIHNTPRFFRGRCSLTESPEDVRYYTEIYTLVDALFTLIKKDASIMENFVVDPSVYYAVAADGLSRDRSALTSVNTAIALAAVGNNNSFGTALAEVNALRVRLMHAPNPNIPTQLSADDHAEYVRAHGERLEQLAHAELTLSLMRTKKNVDVTIADMIFFELAARVRSPDAHPCTEWRLVGTILQVEAIYMLIEILTPQHAKQTSGRVTTFAFAVAATLAMLSSPSNVFGQTPFVSIKDAIERYDVATGLPCPFCIIVDKQPVSLMAHVKAIVALPAKESRKLKYVTKAVLSTIHAITGLDVVEGDAKLGTKLSYFVDAKPLTMDWDTAIQHVNAEEAAQAKKKPLTAVEEELVAHACIPDAHSALALAPLAPPRVPLRQVLETTLACEPESLALVFPVGLSRVECDANTPYATVMTQVAWLHKVSCSHLTVALAKAYPTLTASAQVMVVVAAAPGVDAALHYSVDNINDVFTAHRAAGVKRTASVARQDNFKRAKSATTAPSQRGGRA